MRPTAPVGATDSSIAATSVQPLVVTWALAKRVTVKPAATKPEAAEPTAPEGVIIEPVVDKTIVAEAIVAEAIVAEAISTEAISSGAIGARGMVTGTLATMAFVTEPGARARAHSHEAARKVGSADAGPTPTTSGSSVAVGGVRGPRIVAGVASSVLIAPIG